MSTIMNMIFNRFFTHAEKVGEERDFDYQTISGLKKMWTEEKPKYEKKMKVFRKRIKKEKDAPKNPRSSYIFFCKDERSNVIKEIPDLKMTEVFKELGGRWQGTSDEIRKKYDIMANKDKERFRLEMHNYIPKSEIRSSGEAGEGRGQAGGYRSQAGGYREKGSQGYSEQKCSKETQKCLHILLRT